MAFLVVTIVTNFRWPTVDKGRLPIDVIIVEGVWGDIFSTLAILKKNALVEKSRTLICVMIIYS